MYKLYPKGMGRVINASLSNLSTVKPTSDISKVIRVKTNQIIIMETAIEIRPIEEIPDLYNGIEKDKGIFIGEYILWGFRRVIILSSDTIMKGEKPMNSKNNV